MRGWLLVVLSDEADEADEDGWPAGWLAGWLATKTKNPSKRNISLSVAELKVHQKNIQKARGRAGRYKS